MSLLTAPVQYGPDQLIGTNGLPKPFTPVTVLNALGASAVLYQAGAASAIGQPRPLAPNPLVTDANGDFTFFADPGTYTITAAGVTSYSVTLTPFVAAAQTGLKALPTGRYWAPPGSLATANPANTVLHFRRFVLAGTITIQSLGVEVTGGGTSGAVTRLGLFAVSSDLHTPGALVLDAGTIGTTTTGFKELAISGNQILTPGVYFTLAVSQGGAATPPTYRATNAGGSYPAGTDYEISSTTATDMTSGVGAQGGGYQCGVFTVSGALPATMVGTGATYVPGQNITTVVLRGA